MLVQFLVFGWLCVESAPGCMCARGAFVFSLLNVCWVVSRVWRARFASA